ncbi:MAG: tRNA pseudouridine synthase A [Bacteroidia bacterium]|nr:tRNA pseudouridine synthase A [Bacteroidia bacterium]
MRLFLHLAFNGSSYRGWQWQPGVMSVQETLEQELERIFKQKLTVFGCGRTDAGVHASQYFAHINLEAAPEFDLKFRLNKMLPADIVIFEVLEMADDQHARFDATLRTYDYYIHLQKDPFLQPYSSFYEIPAPDFGSMQQAAALIPSFLDFKAVCKRPQVHNHTLCQVTRAELMVNPAQTRLRFTITANRFLKGMIRILVHHLLQIGAGKMTVAEFEALLFWAEEQPRQRYAFPNGLYLSRVEYPYLKLKPREGMQDFLRKGLGD